MRVAAGNAATTKLAVAAAAELITEHYGCKVRLPPVF